MSGRRSSKLLIGLVVVMVGVAVVDRVGAVIAGRAAATYLAKQANFTQQPAVDIRGVPFLTQVIGGKYRDIEERSGSVALHGATVAATDIHLRGVHLPLSSIFGAKPKSVLCDSVAGTVTISYAEIVRLSPIADLSLADVGGRLTATAKLALIGKTVTVSGRATLSVVDRDLVLNVTQLAVGDLKLSAAELAIVTTVLATPIPLPTLPFGLVIDSVRPASNGVAISASGQHVVLSQTS